MKRTTDVYTAGRSRRDRRAHAADRAAGHLNGRLPSSAAASTGRTHHAQAAREVDAAALSLLSPDTSGANAVAVQQLQPQVPASKG